MTCISLLVCSLCSPLLEFRDPSLAARLLTTEGEGVGSDNTVVMKISQLHASLQRRE
jgi:hypothetical protein